MDTIGFSTLVCLLSHANNGANDTVAGLLGPFWLGDPLNAESGGSIVRSPIPSPELLSECEVVDAAAPHPATLESRSMFVSPPRKSRTRHRRTRICGASSRRALPVVFAFKSVKVKCKAILAMGGAGRIGAVSGRFTEYSAGVAISHRDAPQEITAAVKMMHSLSGEGQAALVADAAQTDTLRPIRGEVERRFGRLEVLVN